MRKTLMVALTLLRCGWASDYYFSNAGDDHAAGISPQTPFKTLSRIRSLATQAGDRFLLDAKSGFHETLILQSKDAGSVELPLVVKSYGEGRAQIVGAKSGIVATDTSNLVIADLFISADEVSSVGNGVWLRSTADKETKNITFRNLLIKGFKTEIEHDSFRPSDRGNGILAESTDNGVGFENLLIEGVEAFANDYAGINIRSRNQHQHAQIRILDSWAHDNAGIRGSQFYSGSGIVVSQAHDVLIEGNQAYQNGARNEANSGPVGIWAWDASKVTIRRNMSYRNHTASTTDGDGFDFDGGVSDSIMEDNWSWGNDGAGYLLCTYPGSGPVDKIVVRNNVSRGDGVHNNYGALTVSGSIANAVIENNRVEVYPHKDSVPSGVLSLYYTPGKVSLLNNSFLLKEGAPFAKVLGGDSINIEENDVKQIGALDSQPKIEKERL